MSEDIWLGKITKAEFGFGGYQDAMIGLSLSFQGKGCGTTTFYGGWSIDRSDYAQWSEADREKAIFDAAWRLKETLEKAKKTHVGQLVGVPVEVTCEGNMLKSWRVLEEVL